MKWQTWVPLQKPEFRLWNFMFWHCVSLVRSVLSFNFPISVMKVRWSLMLVFKIHLTGKWSLGTWILWIRSSLKLQHCRERRLRHVYITVKHLQERWSEGKDNIKQMKHKSEERQSKDGLEGRVHAAIHFSAVFSIVRWILLFANSTFACCHLLGEKEFWFWIFDEATHRRGLPELAIPRSDLKYNIPLHFKGLF